MPKTDYRPYVVALLLMTPVASLFSQNPSVILRLTGDQTKSSSDGLASTPGFMPGISAGYYVRSWGILAEYGAFSSPAQLNFETYIKNIQNFTSRNINTTQWKTSYFLAGIAYRKSLGSGLQANIELSAGMLNMKAPAYSITDKFDGSLIADVNEETKTSTATENSLFALKPEIRLEWFPAQGPVGLNIHAGYLRAFGASEVSTYYRDLSKLQLDGASEQEIRAQVLKSPVMESSSRGPVSNISFGAGISLKIGTAKRSTRQTTVTGFENQEIKHLHKENIVHRDIAARHIVHRDLAAGNLIAGRLEWNPAVNEQGIITNESPASGTEQNPAVQNITCLTLSARKARINGSTENGGTYQPFSKDGKEEATHQDTALVSMKTNPLYTGNHTSGENPLYNGGARTVTNPLYNGNHTSGDNPLYNGGSRTITNPLYHDGGLSAENPLSMAGIEMLLMDAATGDVLASTRTDQHGDFFFAHVPDGEYAVHILGTVTVRQSYDLHANRDADISGIIKTGSSRPFLSLVTQGIPDSFNEQQARQRIADLVSDKNGAANAAYSRQQIKSHFETGDKPTSSQRVLPGNPIGGIIVKGGKNPGGNFITTTTDDNGWFEWPGLKAGDYTLTIIQTVGFNDEVPASLPGQNGKAAAK